MQPFCTNIRSIHLHLYSEWLTVRRWCWWCCCCCCRSMLYVSRNNDQRQLNCTGNSAGQFIWKLAAAVSFAKTLSRHRRRRPISQQGVRAAGWKPIVKASQSVRRTSGRAGSQSASQTKTMWLINFKKHRLHSNSCRLLQTAILIHIFRVLMPK